MGQVYPKNVNIYVDLTVKSPLCSIDGMTTVYILYEWTYNAISSITITNAKYEMMVKSFKENVDYLNKRGFKPKFNIILNVASKAVQD